MPAVQDLHSLQPRQEQTSAATLYGEGWAGRGLGDVFTRSRGS